jgi:hypothetical protein
MLKMWPHTGRRRLRRLAGIDNFGKPRASRRHDTGDIDNAGNTVGQVFGDLRCREPAAAMGDNNDWLADFSNQVFKIFNLVPERYVRTVGNIGRAPGQVDGVAAMSGFI